MPPVPQKTRKVGPFLLIACAVAIVALVWGVNQPVPNVAKGAMLLGLMLVMLLLNINIGVAMAIPGLLGIWLIAGTPGLVNMMTEVPFGNTASFMLSVLPMFVLMGLLLWRSGVTTDLYHAAKCWLGWLPGGLAITTNMAGAGLGAASGSTMGITYAVGRIGIPEMLKAGYDKRLATGAVASAGTIGQLIPPSILLVVYASFAEIPVGPQLMAGIIPGLLLTLAYILLVLGIAVVRPRLAPRPARGERASWGERWISLGRIWPLIALILVVIGGMYLGLFTPTEAGSVGALGALILAAWRQNKKDFLPSVGQALRDTLASVGAIMFLLIGAALLNRMLALTGLARWFADQISDAGLGLVGFVVLLVLVFLVLGMFMEPMATILIVVPILLPVVMEMGFSAIWFGVFVVLMGEIGLLTPPVGMLSFLVHRIAQDKDVNVGQKVGLWDVFQGALWFVPAALAVVFLLAGFPELVDWLPTLMQG
ncbi:MAG: TRAP transporter large permease [Actinomycetota bacterium]